ncbi:MAG: DEAD/DEAH box helicase [Kiritimatiellae bacterium]|nr:DEAD/DEAH box helicase [Kiritimatiellia bacterium]
MFEGSVFGRLDQKLQRAIAEAGYEKPTPIQEEAIPHLLAGRDLIGCAQTGTGKTAAFMLPILDRLVKVRRPRHIGHPRALVLSPTRELAAQTAENVKKYSCYAALPFACVFGGVSQFGQVKDIKKGAETVIACPGRLIDLMTQGILYLDQVECFVLDEADRMLDMGFLPDIRRIISKLPKARQSLFFSATMSPQIMKLAGELVKDPVSVDISPDTPTVEKINQRVMFVEKNRKDSLLIHLLGEHPEWKKVVVFAKMRHGADRINKKLSRAGISSAAIHSDKTQNQRTRALDGFKKGDIRVLVATDIASRGIDVPFVDAVVNMELPLETESYVHRIGRTARAGESGSAVSFVSREERGQLKAVERLIKKTIPVDREGNPFEEGKEMPPAPWQNAPKETDGKESGHGGGRGHHGGRGKKRKSFLGHRQPDFGRKRHG